GQPSWRLRARLRDPGAGAAGGGRPLPHPAADRDAPDPAARDGRRAGRLGRGRHPQPQRMGHLPLSLPDGWQCRAAAADRRVVLASLPSLLQRVDGKLVARDFPIKAADFLVAHPPPGHMLNVYGWGGYLIYRLGGTTPPQPVFIFGDAALAGDQLLRDYDHLQ